MYDVSSSLQSAPLAELALLGLKPCFRSQLAELPPETVPARVALEQRGRYGLLGCSVTSATLAPALLRHAQSRIDLPATGDWVGVSMVADEPRIVQVLERTTQFVRRAAGRATEPQIVAANVDTVAIVSALTEDDEYTARARRSANPRRVERYLVAVRQSGAQPVLVLNKADLCPDTAAVMAELDRVARGVPLLMVSAASGAGTDELAGLVEPGDTLAFVGASGVGKSTLINRLAGADIADVHAIRAGDQRGRHTTTERQLHVLPSGGLLLDTPGMRELGLWADEHVGAEVLAAEVFDEVADQAVRCRYRDCTHQGEPGCAVGDAVDAGEIDQGRVDGFVQLKQEMETTREQRREAKRRWEKDVALAVRRLRKQR